MDDALGCISGASHQAEWLGPPPGRDVPAHSEPEREPQSSCWADAPVEEGAGFEHRMHDNGKFPRHSNGFMLKADPLPTLDAHLRRLLAAELRVRMTVAASTRSPPHVAIATAGEVAILVDLS